MEPGIPARRRMPRFPRTALTRLALLLGLVVLVSAMLVGWQTQGLVERGGIDAAGARARSVAATLSSHLDGERHELIVRALPARALTTWWGQGLAIERLHQELADAQRANSLATPLVTLRMADERRESVRARPTEVHPGAMQVAFTSEPTPMWRAPVDYLPAMQPALDHGAVATATMGRGDHSWVRAWAPIYSGADIVALLQVDVGLEPSMLAAHRAAGAETLLFVASLIICLLAMAAVFFEVGRSLHWLESAVGRLSQGDFVTPVAAAPVSDLRPLTEQLELARKQIHAHVLRLESTEANLVQALHKAQEGAISKSRVLSVLGDEIRAPMNTVVGTMDLLLTSDLDDQQRQYTDAIRNGAARLLSMLQHLLDYSKLDAGQLELRKIPFALVEVVEDTFSQLLDAMNVKGLLPLLHIDFDVPVQIDGDPLRFRQILHNLLDNAIQFTERGEVELRVRLEPDTGRVRFEVRDTGRGFRDEDKASFFRPFSRDTDKRDGRPGMGLGLTIARLLVEQMGGTIGAEGKPLEGATFWFTLPVPAETKAAERAPELAGMRVLVAAAHPSISHSLGSYLTGLGMAAEVTDCRDDALAALDAPYDLVLLDLGMPGQEAVLERARGRCRVFWLVGHQAEHPRALMRQSGVSACLQHPVRRGDLLTRLRAVASLPRPQP